MTSTRQQRREHLVRFLRTIQKPNRSVDDLGDGEGLLTVGLIDSLAILQIVLYLEETYAIDFSVTGVDAEQVATIGSIIDLIERAAA
jgi:acyl carrier protein